MVDSIVFRNDDINENTDFEKLNDLYSIIKEKYPESQILSGVTLLSSYNDKGSVYNDVPFKHRDLDFFYKVNRSFTKKHLIPKTSIVASHGLIHFDHTKLSYEMQKMSVLSSCALLNTNVFIPPFNKYNLDTASICVNHNIALITEDWKSFEFNAFDDNFPRWYFHSWRWTKELFRRAIDGHSEHLGQL